MKTVAYETILLDVADRVATITLNRPERMNAYTWRMGRELQHAFVSLDSDEEVRAIVVTGAGQAFCAGADLESGEDTFSGSSFEERRRVEEALETPDVRPWELSTPIIAAINGAAVGVGITLPMQWDIRIAAEDAKLGFVFVRRGVIPEANSNWIVPRLIGLSRALELMLSGRVFTGAEAAEIGLVSRALPRDQVLSHAQELAGEIARNAAPASVGATKKLIYRFLQETDRGAAHALEDTVFAWAGQTADCAEGIKAFLEKRDPAWKMSKHDLPDGL
ncbi:MAG: enoyl-CoA hydratase-related protein [Actinomycetota bacterium]